MKLSKKNLALLVAVRKGYGFDNENNVVNSSGLKLKLGNIGGYPVFNVTCDDGKRRSIPVHRLKAYFIYGEKIFDLNLVVRHRNNNKDDWSNENILLGTQSQNAFDNPKELRNKMARVGASYLRKFTEGNIIDIRNKRKSGHTLQEIADMYDCSKSTVSYIVNKKTYREIKT